MEVYVKITKGELERYKEYAHILRKMKDFCNKRCGSPGSRDRMECCGCPGHGELAKLLEETGIRNYNESGAIKDYVETMLDFCDARADFERANDRLNILRRKADEAYSKFEVIP